MSPSVSVIMPSCDHAAFVTEAIRSVLDQSHGDLETVITDDGARDGTPDVIRRLADPRIDLDVFEKNQGAAAAMNASRCCDASLTNMSASAMRQGCRSGSLVWTRAGALVRRRPKPHSHRDQRPGAAP